MEMTIDEALKILDNIPTIGEQVDALEMAIETMRKYQQIQKIIEYPDIQEDVLKFKAICEVVEDGNDS